MCGIVCAVAQRDVSPILLEGLKRLEYRGYDSAGIAVCHEGALHRHRTLGKIHNLEKRMNEQPLSGHLGIAHTRWATHGEPSVRNAHPHICNQQVSVVHNGIIENYQSLRETQLQQGFRFTSETDTEVIAHQVRHYHQEHDLLTAVRKTLDTLEGAYALGVISAQEPERLVVARRGSPLVIGVGFGEYFVASDVSALLPVTQRFIFLADGDVADLSHDCLQIYNQQGEAVNREIKESELSADAVSRGEYRHYMLKEIFEQPVAISNTLEGRLSIDHLQDVFGPMANTAFLGVKRVQIIACGTSFHAGVVARYWIESIVRMPCAVEIASEFRYRDPLLLPDTLIVTISQSGETADTLAALRAIQQGVGKEHPEHYPSLVICNVPESSLVRESDMVFMTRAGAEIGVASTKAFTTQLVGLMLLTLALGKTRDVAVSKIDSILAELKQLPMQIDQVLGLSQDISVLAESFADKHHALFLGRGVHYPIALEGALKLKEISYIHAEAYPAGELKHGPLALVDADMPVVAVAPNDTLLEKLQSNLQEVRARGGVLYVFADQHIEMAHEGELGCYVLKMPSAGVYVNPILYSIPLQLLSYYVAVMKGTDVDQPRNLAKSVTVE